MKFTKQQLATVLAALRWWQSRRLPQRDAAEPLAEALARGQGPALSEEQIERLCLDLGTELETPPAPVLTAGDHVHHTLAELVQWADSTGGWNAPCWSRARAIVASGAPESPAVARVIVEVRSGTVTQVYASTELDVSVLDYDSISNGDLGEDELDAFTATKTEAKNLPVQINP